MKSTMTILIEDNARLRLSSRISAIVYWTCLIGGAALGLVKLYGGI